MRFISISPPHDPALLRIERCHAIGDFRRETATEMTGAMALPAGVRRRLGWDLASPYAAGMDTAFGPTPMVTPDTPEPCSGSIR
jgi:hypothetical protein